MVWVCPVSCVLFSLVLVCGVGLLQPLVNLDLMNKIWHLSLIGSSNPELGLKKQKKNKTVLLSVVPADSSGPQEKISSVVWSIVFAYFRRPLCLPFSSFTHPKIFFERSCLVSAIENNT